MEVEMARTVHRPASKAAAASSKTEVTTTAKKAAAKPRTTKAAASKSTATQKKVSIKVKPTTLAEVPDKDKYLHGYINRKDKSGVTDFQAFESARKLKHNILIEGPTGVGKTSAIMAYAAYKGMPFYSVSSSSGTEPSQLFGKYIPDESNGGFVWQDGPVTDLVRNGGVLLINEVNFIPERVSTVLFGLLDKRRKIELPDHKGEVIYATDELMVFADMNPDYEGTRKLNKAFRNRFGTQLAWDYDPDIEKQLVSLASLLDVAQQLRAQIAQGLYDTPVSTNMLMEFEDVALELGVEFATQNFVNHFDDDDRPSVKTVFDTWSSNIVADYEALKKTGKPESKQTVDDDWGIEGIDWVYEEVEEGA